jgi:hypothetical protein
MYSRVMSFPRDLVSNLGKGKKLSRVKPPTVQELISGGPGGRPEPLSAERREGLRAQGKLVAQKFKADNAARDARLAAEAKVIKAAEDALLARVRAR